MQANVKNRNIVILLLCCVVAALAGCAAVPKQPPYFKDISENMRPSAVEGEAAVQPEQVAKEQAPAEAKITPPKIIVIPNPLQRETVTAPAEKSSVKNSQPPEEPAKPIELTAKAAAGDVQIIVENMPIYDFVNLAFGEILKLNYTMSQDVQTAPEKITLNMNSKMAGKVFFPFAVDLLRKNKLVVNEENGMLYVQRKVGAVSEQSAASSDIYIGNVVPSLPPQKRITQIVSASYVQNSQIMQVVKQLQLASGDVRMETLPGSQAVALSGTVAALQKIVALFNQLDRSTFAEREIKLVYFDYANVIDFDKKLKEVLPATGIPVARTAADNGLLTIPFEKINALLVISQKKEWQDAVMTWKDKLDTVESLGDELQLFVYRPKNRPADELVEILKAVSGGAIQTTSAAAATPAPQRQPQAPGRPDQAGAGAATTTLPGKGMTAILDKGRNAVIVSASPANFKLVRNILMQLDTPPRQVLIEATILEVSLTDNFQLGVEWLVKNRLGGGTNSIGTLGGLGLGATGLSYSISKLSEDFQAKLNMYARNNQINIVSTPHIATLDGKEATISVGTEVPIVTSESSASDIAASGGTSGTSANPSVLRSIQYRNTGMILRVKPTINSDGVLTIDIGQELSEAQNNSVSNIDSPMILNRSIKTTLAVQSGETVLLGGLISTNKSTTEQKVPILGDIPLLGHLFKTSSKGETKTELLVQLTPYILNEMGQLEEMTQKFKDTVFLK